MLLFIYNVALFFIDCLVLAVKILLSVFESLLQLVNPPAKKSVVGEIVLVTGAGHGMGRELALQFSRLGAKVVCWDINENQNKSTVKAIQDEGHTSYGYRCDVSQRQDVARVAEQVRRDVGVVTILVNNAGIMPCNLMLNLSAEVIQRTIEVDLLSHFWMIREFLPHMMSAERGHIVAISSMAGKTGGCNLVPYCAAKFGVTGLMDSLAVELYQTNRSKNILVSTVFPNIINTGLVENPYNKYSWLFPFLETEEAVRRIINGVLRNTEIIFINEGFNLLNKMFTFLPRKCMYYMHEFASIGCAPHDKELNGVGYKRWD